MTDTPIKPTPLDSTTIHHPDTVRKWKSDMADYANAVRAIEHRAQMKAQAEAAKAAAPLTDDAYFALKLKAHNDQKAKEAARLAAEKAEELARIDHLMSSPAVAEVFQRTEYTAIQEIIHWASRGYTLADSGFLNFHGGVYHLQMNAPAKKVGK